LLSYPFSSATSFSSTTTCKVNPNIPINPNNNYYIKDPLHPVNLIYIIDQLKLDHSENSSLMKNISTDDIYIWNPTDNSYAPLGAIIHHNLSHFKDPIRIHSYENLNDNSLLSSLKNIETQISKYNEEKGLNNKKTYVFTSIRQRKKNNCFCNDLNENPYLKKDWGFGCK
jgi:hypothetical protein